jgi:hypothetical protein
LCCSICGVNRGSSDRLVLSFSAGPCTAGYYCDVGSITSTSSACPAHSTSLTGADSIADCLCYPGYYSDVNGGECFACGVRIYHITTLEIDSNPSTLSCDIGTDG